ncbi:MAG: hypothetical protein ACK44E_00445 [Anaerolineales bacterium]
MTLSAAVIILAADERVQQAILHIFEEMEMISTPTIGLDFEKAKQVQKSNQTYLCLAEMRLLPPPAQVALWLSSYPQIKLLVLHPRLAEDEVLAYLQAGAMGHLAVEELDSNQVKLAIRALLNGEAFLSPSTAGKILDTLAKRHLKENKKEVQE